MNWLKSIFKIDKFRGIIIEGDPQKCMSGSEIRPKGIKFPKNVIYEGHPGAGKGWQYKKETGKYE